MSLFLHSLCRPVSHVKSHIRFNKIGKCHEYPFSGSTSSSMPTVRRTDMMKLIAAFHYFANASKKYRLL